MPAVIPPVEPAPDLLVPGAARDLEEIDLDARGDGGQGLGVHKPGADTTPDGALEVVVPLGRRVVVVADLLLEPTPTPSTLAVAAEVARTLDEWQGPGVVIFCGNLFSGPRDSAAVSETDVCEALASHDELFRAVREFAAHTDRRLIVLPGWRDRVLADAPRLAATLDSLGAQRATSVQLDLVTATGRHRVVVRPGEPADGAPGARPTGAEGDRPWLAGIDRLEDPSACASFVTSRTLYRRLARYALLPLLPAVVALLLRLPFVYDTLDDLLGGTSVSRRAIAHAYSAGWSARLLTAGLLAAAVLVVFAVIVTVASRGIWRALGGEPLPRLFSGGRELGLDAEPSIGLRIEGNDALDEARALVARGADGLVTGGGLRAELVHLDAGFFACPGGTTELVRRHRTRAGLPPVFLHHRQTGWVELETGAGLHVRLLRAEVDLPSSTALERVVTRDRMGKGYKPAGELRPSTVASWPTGTAWPQEPDLAAGRARTRRVRRLAAGALFLAGLVDILSAVTPPLRGHLGVLRQLLPLEVAQTADALVALTGIGLTMMARGILRGQRRSWLVAVCLLAASLVFHLAHGARAGGLVVSAAVLLLLLVERDRFGATADKRSVRSAGLTLISGAAVAVAAAVLTIELAGHVRHQSLPGFPAVLVAATERLAGLTTVALPDRIDDWVYPSLLAVGIGLALLALSLLTRPVVDRTLTGGRSSATRRAAEHRARDIVRRHGTGTLDYFALRDDKRWFFHRDSAVAFAVYGGICLVSPDPIGPSSDREHVWAAFRRYCDHNGWGIAVMAASEEWLPIYRETGMRHIYIGDEAVVDVQAFSLEGGEKKGLRQAVNRIARHGYTVRFFDPATVDTELQASLRSLVQRHRRGQTERGFSMMLGRLFDPRDGGLLLTVVFGPDGEPVAVCQFVPSRAIGGYSLDLMRRDPGRHPNGLLDFALCSTIAHVRELGLRGVSLNFAAMRTTLEGECDRVTRRVERWAIHRLSGFLQIESLWRFNAKYEPAWLPRYIVYDSPEHFAPSVVAILRAEGLSEVPVVGRLLSGGNGAGTIRGGTGASPHVPGRRAARATRRTAR